MGMSGKGGGSPMANPSLPLVGAPTSAPQFYTPGPFGSGMMFGGGSGYYGGAQSPYNPPGAGFYGGDALGTAGQLLNGGSPPSFNAAAGGNVQGIGYWPQNTPGAGGGKGGKGGGTGLPPPTGTSGAGAAPPPSGGGGTTGGGNPAPSPATSPASFSAGQLAQANGSQGPQGNSGFGPGAPGAVPSTNQYAPVGSAAWAQQNHVNPQGVQSMLARGPWNSQQLDQAYAINPGLAAYMYREVNPLAGQQFMQDHGFANAPGSQTMLNQAGANFTFAQDPTYGAQARNAQGQRLLFGTSASGTPYSYTYADRAAPGFARWQQTGQGAVPQGVTMYNQFAPSGSSGS